VKEKEYTEIAVAKEGATTIFRLNCENHVKARI
jgi:hypothetical protein